jgi:hypothetical protein
VTLREKCTDVEKRSQNDEIINLGYVLCLVNFLFLLFFSLDHTKMGTLVGGVLEFELRAYCLLAGTLLFEQFPQCFVFLL